LDNLNHLTGSTDKPQSARAASLNKLAATDEKDLSTAQSQTHPDARLPRPHGHARRTQNTEAPARTRTDAAGDLDSAQAARLERDATEPARSEWSFGPADRLHRRAEYLRLQKLGARYQTTHFVMYAGRLAEFDRSRLGMTVSRRIGSAVVRNRTRRRIRECYRLKLRPLFPDGIAIVVIARAGAGALASPAIASELLQAASNLAARIARETRDARA
jgi:ribonuclease P protein component